MWRAAIPIAALLLVLPALTAAQTIPVQERLVEGHTSYSVFTVAGENDTVATRFAAGVAVLIREVVVEEPSRFGGVLWFNDQYLVAEGGSAKRVTYRHPCTGAVLAVAAGDPDPRPAFAGGPLDANVTVPQYVHSYYITDPLDRVWIIDKWRIDGSPVWTVPLLNNLAGVAVADEGHDCPPYGSNPCHHPLLLPDEEGCYDGEHSLPEEPVYSAFPYNALLVLPLDEIAGDRGVKDHRARPENLDDVSGCHAGGYTSDWPCPDDDDDREGNSHPYHPSLLRMSFTSAEDVVGKRPVVQPSPRGHITGGHGGSADCDGDGFPDADCHASVRIDLYYGLAGEPPQRKFREDFVDVIGSAAPYLCSDDGGCSGTGVEDAEDDG